MEKPRFKVSYRGEAKYTINGKCYALRYFAEDDGHYNGNYYETGIEPFVGCVYNCHGDFHAFPPREIIEAFFEEHPGIVGARYAAGRFDAVEYTAPRSVIVEDGVTLAVFHVEEMKKYRA